MLTDLQKLVANVDPKVMEKVDIVLKNLVTKSPEAAGQQPMSERAQAALKAVARILTPFKDEISGDHVAAVQQEIGMGCDNKVEMSQFPEKFSDQQHAQLEKMGYRKYPDQQPKVGTAAVDKSVEAADSKNQEDEVDKVTKIDLSAFPKEQAGQLQSVFKAMEDLQESNKTLVQKNGDLEKQLKEERDVRVLKGFEEKAKGFTHLSANSSELAQIMKTMAESDPKQYEKIEAVLTAANEQIRVAKTMPGGLLGEIGSRTQGSGSGPDNKLDALVDSHVAKSTGKTREQVYDEVLKTTEGKRLYAEYKASRPHGI